jgi:hypothetical protein
LGQGLQFGLRQRLETELGQDSAQVFEMQRVKINPRPFSVVSIGAEMGPWIGVE